MKVPAHFRPGIRYGPPAGARRRGARSVGLSIARAGARATPFWMHRPLCIVLLGLLMPRPTKKPRCLAIRWRALTPELGSGGRSLPDD